MTFSTLDSPRLQFIFECRLMFTRVFAIPDVHNGGFRSAVLVDEGTFEGPGIDGQGFRGRAIPNSGGDYAHFRADDTAVFDARYLLEVDDGTVIYMQNRGYLWGRAPDAMGRLRAWAFEGGPPVAHEDYYLRAQPLFETPRGRHDWMTRHVFIGVGERKPDGNLVRYYALT